MDSSVLCWDPFPFPLWDTDKAWWSNVQRKAQFPPAYHCSISSSVLPEIDGVRGWTKARDLKAINCFLFLSFFFFFTAEEGDITIRLCWLAADHKLSWAPPVFMTGGGGTGELRGLLGTGLASIVPLATFHSRSFSLLVTLLHSSSSHQASVSRFSALFWSHSQPCVALGFFIAPVFLVPYFNGVHILYIALPLVSELPSSPPLSVCHPLGLEIGLGSNKIFDFITVTCKSKYI